MQIDQFDDGHGPLRSYLGPRDLAVMIRAILDAPREQVRTVNLALPGPVHAETLVDALSTALDRRLPWQFRPAPENAVSQVVLATDRIAALAGLSVRPDTEAHLAAQVAEMGLGAARS
jgi:nucleoside-diphosphate-sugar epimerase